jgi:feruloyl-CoA synthase
VDLGDPALRAHLAERLTEMNRGAGSAHRIQRLLLLATPPDIDAGEITDKGYINQRVVLQRRDADVGRLFAEPVADDVITPAAADPLLHHPNRYWDPETEEAALTLELATSSESLEAP